jgi:primosomal protein N' (replication factor Y)
LPRFAQVAVNVPVVQDLFDYSIPSAMAEMLDVGWLVEVPFGNQTVQGILLRQKDTSDVTETRPIENVLEGAPVVTPAQIALAEWLSEQYFVSVSAYLFAMLPPGLGQKADTLYQLNPVQPNNAKEPSPLQRRILAQLKQRGPLRGRQLDAAIRQVDWRPVARALVRQHPAGAAQTWRQQQDYSLRESTSRAVSIG